MFIPAAGYCSGFNIYNERSYGYLWSSSLRFRQDSCYLSFNPGIIDLYSGGRYFGFTIRPVINL